MDDDEIPRDLPTLGREIQRLATETDVRHLPDYKPISPPALIQAIKDFQGVKERLSEGDRASVIDQDGEQIDFDLTVKVDIDKIEELAVRETLSYPVPSMVLIVKRPDYLGNSMWDMRHGRKSISARIQDEKWLARFQGREIDVRPGDALRSRVRIEMSYGHDNELLAERYFVEEVFEVLENQYTQQDLFDDGSR